MDGTKADGPGALCYCGFLNEEIVEVEVTAGEFGGGLVVVEVLEDLSDEAVELGVLLDVIEAVTASADYQWRR